MINSAPKFQKSVKVIRTVSDALRDNTAGRVRGINCAFWSSLRERSRPAIAKLVNCKADILTSIASTCRQKCVGPSRRRRTRISHLHVVGATTRPAVFSFMSGKLEDAPTETGNCEGRQRLEKEELRRKEDERLRREKEMEDKIGPPPEKPIPGDCCGNGCTPCVWDTYWDELEEYQKLRKSVEESLGDSTKL